MNIEGLQEYFLLTIILGVPCWRILRRAGLPSYYIALVVVPILGYLAIEALLAFSRWPRIHPPLGRTGANDA